ncbi:MAG: hypothetical protein K5829_13345 [Treponema sp.]|nr:hypothetical protein [Treponema sp.]
MNNHALKLVKEKGSISLKVNKLIKLPDEDFHNLDKQFLYEQGRYCHRSQHGILRVSKYEFFSSFENRNILLKKHSIEIDKVDYLFDYAESTSEKTKIWYINFADRYAFNNKESRTYNMEHIQILNMPLLYKVSRVLLTDPYSCITSTTYYNDAKRIIPTPLLFENVPQWFDIKNTDDLKKNKVIQRDKYNNIISMVAPFTLDKEYTKENIYYLCKTLFAGLGGIVEQGKKSKIKDIEFHTGNWGCGLSCNNKELIYLSQMLVASIMGFKKIIFHAISDVDYENALKKYKVLVDEFSFEEMVSYLDSQNYRVIRA